MSALWVGKSINRGSEVISKWHSPSKALNLIYCRMQFSASQCSGAVESV